MGIVHTRGRLAPALILTVLAAVTALVVLGLTAGPAAAYSGYVHDTGMTCTSCHKVSTSVPPTNADCAQSGCHVSYTTAHPKGGVASTCWTCHTPGQNMATIKTNAATGGCGASAAAGGCHGPARHPGATLTTCVTCHGVTASTSKPGQSAHHKMSVTDVTVKPVLTVAVSTTRTTLGRTVKLSGKARPITPTYRVTITVQKRTATGAWAKVTTKAGSLPNATTYAWSVSYKPLKRGVYRFLAKTPKVASTTTLGVTAVSAGSRTSKLLTIK